MAHITLSIPDETYKKMKMHPEIKWSEVAREGISTKLRVLKQTTHSSEVLEMLSPETRQSIGKTSEAKAKTFAKKVREEKWKEVKSLTRAHYSKPKKG